MIPCEIDVAEGTFVLGPCFGKPALHASKIHKPKYIVFILIQFLIVNFLQNMFFFHDMG